MAQCAPITIATGKNSYRVMHNGASVEIIGVGYTILGDFIYEVGHGIRRTSWEDAYAVACSMLER